MTIRENYYTIILCIMFLYMVRILTGLACLRINVGKLQKDLIVFNIYYKINMLICNFTILY